MLTPFVNVDVKMSKPMLRALSLFETFCVVQNKLTTTEQEIKAFITERFDAELAAKFEPSFMFTSQDASTSLQ